jgi:hypothetical protein
MTDELKTPFVMSSESLARSEVERVETSLIVIRKNSERFLDFATLRSE